MDLISGLRKGDTSRGGRAEFSWDAVKEDKDRENYLGHSLMAPVGRWQRGKDLTWYAKGDSKESMTEEEQRKEEIRRVKQAEEDAIAAALGLPVPNRDNANEEPLGERRGDPEEKDEAKKCEGKEGSRGERSRRHRSRDRSRDRERRHRHRSRSRRRGREHRHRDERDRDRDRERHKRHDERRRSRSRSRTRSPHRYRNRESRRG
jgi:hypothetical protein